MKMIYSRVKYFIRFDKDDKSITVEKTSIVNTYERKGFILIGYKSHSNMCLQTMVIFVCIHVQHFLSR